MPCTGTGWRRGLLCLRRALGLRLFCASHRRSPCSRAETLAGIKSRRRHVCFGMTQAATSQATQSAGSRDLGLCRRPTMEQAKAPRRHPSGLARCPSRCPRRANFDDESETGPNGGTNSSKTCRRRFLKQPAGP